MKNSDNIHFGGGGDLWINSDLSQALPQQGGSGWQNLGYLESLKLIDVTEITKQLYSDAGALCSIRKRDAVALEAVLLQSSVAEISLPNNYNDVQLYYPVPAENGIIQQWRFRLAQIRRDLDVNFGRETRLIAFKFSLSAYNGFPFYYIQNDYAFVRWGQTEFNLQSLEMPFYELT